MKTLKLTDFASEVQKLAKSIGQEYSCVKVGITTSEYKGNTTYKNEYQAYINGGNWVEAPTAQSCLDIIKNKIMDAEPANVII